MILVDYRRGSGTAARSKSGDYTDIVNYSPLNTCTTCGKPFHLTGNEWRCSSGDASHTAPTVITHLNSADLAIPGNGPAGPLLIGVEVKSLSDLISSWESGRLQTRQIPEMRRDYHSRFLLYYGAYRCCPQTGAVQTIQGKGWADYTHGGSRRIPYNYMMNIYFHLINSGVHVYHVAMAKKSDCLAECARWVAALARQWGKRWEEHEGLKRFNEAGDNTDADYAATLFPEEVDEAEQLRAEMASRIPGVGYKRGRAVAAHFASSQDMVNADVDEWAEIKAGGKRLGPVLARATVELLRRRSKRPADTKK